MAPRATDSHSRRVVGEEAVIDTPRPPDWTDTPVAGSPDGDEVATETSMSTETDTAAGAGTAGAPVTAGGPGDVTAPTAWRDRPWGRVLLVLAGLAVVALAAVVVVTRSDPGPRATMLGRGVQPLSEVPMSATVERWTLDLGLKDRVAVVGDRVVVADDPFPDAAARDQVLRAHHLRSRQVLWETPLPAGARFVVVDAGGRAVLPEEATESTRDARGSTVGIDAADGSVLWERDGGNVESGPGPDSVLVQRPGGGCELVAARSGDPLLQSDRGFCVALDGDHLAVQVDEGWEVRGMDRATIATFAGPQPPAATDDLLVGIDGDGEVVARDTRGEVRWRRSTDITDGGVRAVPGTGFMVSAYDQEADAMRSELLDPQGRSLPREAGDQSESALFLEFDGRRLALEISQGQRGDRLVVRDVDDGAEFAAEDLDPAAVSSWGAFTSRGLLSVDRTTNRLMLRAWPDLDEAWSVDLAPDMVFDDQGPPPPVQSSTTGLVVVVPVDQGAVLHAYS